MFKVSHLLGPFTAVMSAVSALLSANWRFCVLFGVVRIYWPTTSISMVPSMPGKFQAGHQVKYGLKVTSRHSKSSEVASVMYHFCAAFGREERLVAR